MSFSNNFADVDEGIRVLMNNESNRRTSNIVDFDGSLTGISSGAVIGSNGPFWKVGSDCTYRNDWTAWVCPLTSVRANLYYYVSRPHLMVVIDENSSQCRRKERQ